MPYDSGFANNASRPKPLPRDTFTYVASLLALTVRLLIVFAIWHTKSADWFYSQASELGAEASSICMGHGIASPFGGATGPSAFLPPGYPVFVAAIFKMFGSYSHAAELVLLLAQACFGTVAVHVTMLLAGRLLGATPARVTGLLLALHPWLIALSFVFWETSFSLMMLVTLVWITVRWIENPSPRFAYAAAGIGALAISVNASLALTCVALFLWAVYSQRDRNGVLLPGVLFIGLCSIWPVRNELQMNAFIPLRDNFGYELWQGNRVGSDGFFAPELHPNTNRVEFQKFQQLGELSYMQEKSSTAKADIAAQPLRFLRLSGKRVLCFWLGVSRQTHVNQIAIATFTTFLGVCGLLMFVRRQGLSRAVPLVLPLALFPAPYYITHPDFRFWCLLSPVLTALGVYLLTCWREERGRRITQVAAK